MLSSFDDDEYILSALKAGALGYVLKNVSDEMLVNALRMAYRHERVLSPQITERVVRWAITESPQQPPVVPSPTIDRDEKQILQLLVNGASNTSIASQLFMSTTTVKRRLRKLFAKMNVQTRTQAAAEAVRRGLV